MPRKLVNLRLPEELLGRVDAAADAAGQTRTKFLERALEKALGDSPAVHGPSRSGGLPASSRASKKAPSIRDTWAR